MSIQRQARAGSYVRQVTGYRAFIPKPLPPNPELAIDPELLAFLSQADQALGRLDAAADMLPSPDRFVSMYVRREAVLSSQIEGTQASLSDVLEFEASQAKLKNSADVAEVVNYIQAMNHGLERLTSLPLSNRLLREIHRILLTGARGEDRSPGEFRTTQNWIGPENSDLSTAAFVPPPPYEMNEAMGALELYMHDTAPMPPVVKAGFLHSQFETIHPFLDGNGRMGRLLITFFLCEQGVLKRPLLYLSAYFKEHRQEYYGRLQAVRVDGDWEGWMKFFLVAVAVVSKDAAERARQILRLREEHRDLVQTNLSGSGTAFNLIEQLYERPYVWASRAADLLEVSYPTANNLLREFVDLGLLEEVTGGQRNRLFRYGPYLELLEKPFVEPVEPDPRPPFALVEERTQSGGMPA